MKILIREGSAAKNFDALIDLLPQYYEEMMFCSDDKHPDDLQISHINGLCARAMDKGMDLFKVLQVACINPVEHYGLKMGLLRPNDLADFIVVQDLKKFKVLKTYIEGELVSEFGKSLIKKVPFKVLNNFNTAKKATGDFAYPHNSNSLRVIEALDGELITKETISKPLVKEGNVISNLKEDVLKMAVVNRYRDEKPSIAFIKNFGLTKGAIASSVAHDSHNIVVVGTSDSSICNAVNAIIENRGGVCAHSEEQTVLLPLPVAGIMSNRDAESVARDYAYVDAYAKQLGCKLGAPFMTLSFMALLVIPSLKLSDKGLFDVNAFQLVN